MSNIIFTINLLTKSETLDPKSIDRLYTLKITCKFMEIKSNEPRLPQKEMSKQLGFSNSSIKRYSDDRNMNSPYKRNINTKRTIKRKLTTTSENLSKNENL